SALFGWDIKNEPDLDFESRTQENVLAWLEEMITRIRTWDPEHPVTIGWSSATAARYLADQVNFVSFHYYQEPSEFVKTYKELKERIGGKSILLSEYGYSSYSGFWNLYTGSETNQADYYEIMQNQLIEEKLPYLFWTLFDFDEVPNSVVGRLPWRKERQKRFGIITVDGERKSAYQYLDKSGLK
ncbi:MAG: glycoside hydrolase family 5 protein, partial [Muriicola sp.]|nr:glycoside hydrolase family 5 protein [Muriicola sp.]